ncbi:MAG: hypothetical protein RLZ75_2318 [Pseudomonadota bacterium]|jgi:hypothetical protein
MLLGLPAYKRILIKSLNHEKITARVRLPIAQMLFLLWDS